MHVGSCNYVSLCVWSLRRENGSGVCLDLQVIDNVPGVKIEEELETHHVLAGNLYKPRRQVQILPHTHPSLSLWRALVHYIASVNGWRFVWCVCFCWPLVLYSCSISPTTVATSWRWVKKRDRTGRCSRGICATVWSPLSPLATSATRRTAVRKRQGFKTAAKHTYVELGGPEGGQGRLRQTSVCVCVRVCVRACVRKVSCPKAM